MRQAGTTLRLSATDLANHLACRHLTALDLMAAEGKLEPPYRGNAGLDAMRERGMQHEAAFVEHLAGKGLTIARLPEGGGGLDPERGLDRTLAAMRAGADAIVQATLASGRWLGIADVLLRVDRSSALGNWSYEAVDTKLARETRGGTILQISLYSDLLAEMQGVAPEFMSVVRPNTGFRPDRFRVSDFMAYYRLVRRRLEEAVSGPEIGREGAQATYPEPVPHCDVCRWWTVCNKRRRADDHLSFVAGISRRQTRELEERGIGTLELLGRRPLPVDWKPKRGTREGYLRVGEQARVQLEGRRGGGLVHELLPIEADRGLARLPAPSPGDVFLDLEGDPFAGEGGVEFLFGYAYQGESGDAAYRADWALEGSSERAAFERFVDFVVERWERHPDLHVYHFAPYEPAALKRLMGRYATREGAIDRMLRAGLFVDLYAVVRQGLRASVERYSIKDLEPFFGFERGQPLDEVSEHMQRIQWALEVGDVGEIGEASKQVVERYNRDDCLAALRLRDWLERLRSEIEAKGQTIPRPTMVDGAPSGALDDRQKKVEALRSALTSGVPEDRSLRTRDQEAAWLLAHMLDWHRREEKAPWWEFFRLRELSDEELLEDRAAIAGLEFVEVLDPDERGTLHRYTYPRQDTNVRPKAKLQSRDHGSVGKIDGQDLVARTIDIRKSKAAIDVHPTSVFVHDVFPARESEAALHRIGTWVASHGIDGQGPYRAARDLLLNRTPRIAGVAEGAALYGQNEDAARAARDLVPRLDHGVLPVQGPPGSGKTYAGARMICDLVRKGRKVGVTAISHKVVRKLLDGVVDAAKGEGPVVRCAQKVSEDVELGNPAVTEVSENEDALALLTSGEAQVLGGTAWMWSREEFFEAVDVLFVDEAGQTSLANAVAVAQAAKNLVLLGDPQQLQQPVQGSHPPGTEVSVLEHVLQGAKTIPPERGVFLSETWRLHPAICSFTSELFYEDRLKSRPGLERQVLAGAGPFDGAGIWYVPVEHEGNQSASREEVDAVSAIVRRLLAGSVTWSDSSGAVRRIGPDDIKIVAPYNAQVADLSERIKDVAIGTVDKFQGQEAPIVIYSLTTSDPEDAPRGMDFLYALDRLNVATSRARCVCIVVGSPRLFEPECQTPDQMRRANALCRLLEVARGTG